MSYYDIDSILTDAEVRRAQTPQTICAFFPKGLATKALRFL